MRNVIWLFIAGFFLFACKSKKVEKEPFLSYKIFIQNDLSKLDSSPLAVMAFTLDSNKKVIDSAIISKQQFKEIAAQFYTPNVTDKAYFENFREDRYSDEGTNLFNFTYTPENGKGANLPLKMVVVGTSLENNSTFKNLLITKENEKQQRQQLYWESGKFCQIVTFDAASSYVVTKKYKWGI